MYFTHTPKQTILVQYNFNLINKFQFHSLSEKITFWKFGLNICSDNVFTREISPLCFHTLYVKELLVTHLVNTNLSRLCFYTENEQFLLCSQNETGRKYPYLLLYASFLPFGHSVIFATKQKPSCLFINLQFYIAW